MRIKKSVQNANSLFATKSNECNTFATNQFYTIKKTL